MKLFQLLIFTFIISLTSCQRNSEIIKQENDNKIKTIYIEFFPAFHRPSTAIIDMENGTVLFKRIGSKVTYRPGEYPVIEEIKAMKSIHFKMDSCNYKYFTDSIIFKEDDFIDRETDAFDGIFNTMQYIFEDKTMHDVDLWNDLTKNQHQFITRLIDLAIIKSESDSIGNTYLKRLKEYY